MLAIRPLLFSLLKKRLDRADDIQNLIAPSGSARALLNMGVESAQHIVAVLERLKAQNLLGMSVSSWSLLFLLGVESFMPFDLEAAFTAGMTLLLAPFLGAELLVTSQPWLDMIFGVLDELTRQGHLQAAARKNEMQQLQQIFRQSLLFGNQTLNSDDQVGRSGNADHQIDTLFGSTNEDPGMGGPNFTYNFFDDAIWPTTFTADQLMTVVDGLDLEGMEEITTGSTG